MAQVYSYKPVLTYLKAFQFGEVEVVVQGISSGNGQNMVAILKDLGGIMLKPGQLFSAVVAAQKGKLFFLQVGDKMLPVRAETDLTVGQKLTLQVIKWQGEELLVRQLPLALPEVTKNETRQQQLLRILEKFGLSGEKELPTVLERMQKLPVDEQTAIRFLLDPSILTALLIPREKEQQWFDQIEINCYKGVAVQGQLWEVTFQLALPVLGHLEVKMKMVQQEIFTQIWTDSFAAETILREKQKDLAAVCTHVEIIPVAEGPLIKTDFTKKIDLMV